MIRFLSKIIMGLGLLALAGLGSAASAGWSGCNASIIGGLSSIGEDDNSPSIGARLGCDHQFGIMVLGVFGQASWDDAQLVNPTTLAVGNLHSTIDLGARVGIGSDTILLYALAAWTTQDINLGGSIDGLSLGGGLEVALSERFSIAGEFYRTNNGSSLEFADTDRHRFLMRLTYKFWDRSEPRGYEPLK